MNSLICQVYEGIRQVDITKQIPDHSIKRSLYLAEWVLITFDYDSNLIEMSQCQEPIVAKTDRWRRVQAGVQNKFQQLPKVIMEEQIEQEIEIPPPEWAPFEVPPVDLTPEEEEFNLTVEQLRQQIIYRERLREEYEKHKDEQEKLILEEKRKIRNLVDGSPDRITYDYDGKIILKNNKLKLAPLGNHLSGKEIIPEESEVEVVEVKLASKRPPKMKYKHSFIRLKPPVLNQDVQNIVLQQENNPTQGFLEKVQMKPGVFLQMGNIEKGTRHHSTQAQELPFQIQNSIDKYLSQEASNSIRLSKEEYSSITGNRSILKGSYEQSFIKKKSQVTNRSQSIVEEVQPKEGIVKVNDIGKFYELLIKDNEDEVENQDYVSGPMDMPSQQFKLPAISPNTDLPSIPATQFYRYLQNQSQSHQNLSNLDKSSVSGSMTSKLTRDRSMPGAITSLKVHRFLAAPKIGKFLGFGVNAKYNF